MSHDFVYWSALLIGFAGSLHCIGMCGPIVMVLPGSVAERVRFLAGRFLYNIGRVAAYGTLGIVAGMIGQAFTFAGWQQRIGIVAGAVMILSVVLPAVFLSKKMPANPLSPMVGFVKEKLSQLLSRSHPSSLFLIGFLNGFLPCGLVYTAMIGSVSTGYVAGSILYMMLFGVGTIPVMLATAYAANFITQSMRRKLTKFLPVGVVLLGMLFMLRGLSLGIPFVSPDMDMMKKKTERKLDSSVNRDVKTRM